MPKEAAPSYPLSGGDIVCIKIKENKWTCSDGDKEEKWEDSKVPLGSLLLSGQKAIHLYQSCRKKSD